MHAGAFFFRYAVELVRGWGDDDLHGMAKCRNFAVN